MHIKRKTIPNFWPVPKTGTKYLAVPNHEQGKALSVILITRNILEIVKTKKELKKLLNEKKISVNGKIINEVNYPVCLFDVISFPTIKKHYRLMLKKRYTLAPISEKEAETKIYKVIGKTMLPNKKIQINLSQGRNIISHEKINSGDFVEIHLLNNKIMKIIPLKKDVEILVVAGKHIGKTGKIKDILVEGSGKVAVIKTKEGEVKANIDNIFATH